MTTAAQQIQKARQIESRLELERNAFEHFVHRRYLSENQQISNLVATERPATVQAVCWRLDDGAYGSPQINNAWMGWKARAMFQILTDEALAQGEQTNVA